MACSSVLIRSIPSTVSEQELKELLDGVGTLKSCTLSQAARTAGSLQWATCEFQDAETAEMAVELLNGTEFHGSELDVIVADPKEAAEEAEQFLASAGSKVAQPAQLSGADFKEGAVPEQEKTKKEEADSFISGVIEKERLSKEPDPLEERLLSVSNLSAMASESSVRQLFESAGIVTYCSVIDKGTSCSAFIHLDTAESAQQAIHMFDGLILGGQKVSVVCKGASAAKGHVTTKPQQAIRPDIVDAMHYTPVAPVVEDRRLNAEQPSGFSTVCINGIPVRAAETDLRKHFEPCGDITRCNFYAASKKEMFFRSGFCKYAEPEAASRAAAELHGSELLGVPLRVCVLGSRPAPLENHRAIFITGFPRDVTEEALRKVCEVFGGIEKISIVDDAAYCTFLKPESSIAAIVNLHGTVYMGGTLIVTLLGFNPEIIPGTFNAFAPNPFAQIQPSAIDMHQQQPVALTPVAQDQLSATDRHRQQQKLVPKIISSSPGAQPMKNGQALKLVKGSAMAANTRQSTSSFAANSLKKRKHRLRNRGNDRGEGTGMGKGEGKTKGKPEGRRTGKGEGGKGKTKSTTDSARPRRRHGTKNKAQSRSVLAQQNPVQQGPMHATPPPGHFPAPPIHQQMHHVPPSVQPPTGPIMQGMHPPQYWPPPQHGPPPRRQQAPADHHPNAAHAWYPPPQAPPQAPPPQAPPPHAPPPHAPLLPPPGSFSTPPPSWPSHPPSWPPPAPPTQPAAPFAGPPSYVPGKPSRREFTSDVQAPSSSLPEPTVHELQNRVQRLLASEDDAGLVKGEKRKAVRPSAKPSIASHLRTA